MKTRSFHDPENEDCPHNLLGCTCEEPDFKIDFQDPTLLAQIHRCIEEESGTSFIWPSRKRASMFIKILNLLIVAKRLGLALSEENKDHGTS